METDGKSAGLRRLDGKVCVVTGAGQGIGRATARRLAAEGARVAVADRVEEGAVATVALLREAGAEAATIIADVGSFAGAQALVAETLAAFGRIDVLVNNVGGTIWIKPYHLYTEDEVKLELERSLHPTLWCCLAVLPVMMRQGGGAIINIGSQAVRGIYRVPYAASKGGIAALTKVLALEYGDCNIRVNCVSPGGTDIPDRITPRRLVRPGVMVDDVADAEAYAEEMRADSHGKQALKRRGRPDDQASAVAFLASDDASFITGEIINCSGGQS
jgi:NAD(P)-dependent dehydrogenase (short-subunit alcohol dehydrogenase family)